MESVEEIKLYKRRWLLMGVFIVYLINSSMQWIQFSVISDIIVKFYNVSPYYVEWTTDVFVLTYIIFLIPSLYLLDKAGIRNMMVIICVGMCVAAWIKVFSAARDKFFLAFVGQTIQAVCAVLNFGIAARFTAIWFGAEEISLAGSISLFGDQLGMAFGFFVPPQIVQNNQDLEIVGTNLRRMHIAIAALSSTILILVVLVFTAEPENPPSAARMLQKRVKIDNIWKPIIEILRAPAFLLMSAAYGLCNGSFVVVSKLLNEIVLTNFPNRNEDVGNIGFILMLSGIIGSPIVAHILDRTRKFKENIVVLTTGACLSMIVFTVALKLQNIVGVYIAAAMFGLFLQSLYVTGVQTCIEITYPVAESISSSVMFLLAQVLTIIMTLSFGYILKRSGDLTSNIGVILALLASATIACLIPPNLKRQNAEKIMKTDAPMK